MGRVVLKVKALVKIASVVLFISAVILVGVVACKSSTATRTTTSSSTIVTQTTASVQTKITTPTAITTQTSIQTATTPPSRTTLPTTATQTTTPTVVNVSLDLIALNIAFDKSTITVPAGANVTINFNNKDTGVPHNFAVYQNLSGGQTTPIFVGDTITGPSSTVYHFKAPAADGSYFFECDVHPTTMNGRFKVVAP